jgi:hypothetical protein
MGQDLKAFISYRRHDAFMLTQAGVSQPNYAFLDKVEAALKQVGFKDTFVDKSAIQAGEQYESKIHQNVSDCDLFVAVIGTDWLNILRQKAAARERDVLVREIRAALRQEKQIVPLLVDGAAMPQFAELPEQIGAFHFRNGVPILSTDSATDIASSLRGLSNSAASVRKLDARWSRIYLFGAIAAYLICAILPHIIGSLEFGEAWGGMAEVWSGLFVWPIFFLPFVLLALYRPLTILIESVINAPRWQDRLAYSTPLVLGTILTVLAVALEVVPPEVPWSIYPALPGCPHTSGEPLARYSALSQYDSAPQADLRADGPLHERYGDRFWLKNKCWPNVFYYLTVPLYQLEANADYLRERPQVQKALKSLLEDKTGAPYSWSFFPYIVSFTIMIWLAATGILMAIFYVTVQIRRPDGLVLHLPSEDAYLCLTYSFVTLMVWLPFRMNTNYFKKLYFCGLQESCGEVYFKDWVFAAVLLIGYIYLTVGLLVKYHRVALGLLGAAAVAVIVAGAFAVFRYGADIAPLLGWTFYIGISIPAIIVLLALWYQFDPSIVHFNDFKEEI